VVAQLSRLEENPTQSVDIPFKFNTFVLSVIKGFTGKEKHVYILKNKDQLNSFVNSIRQQSLESFRFSPKPAKLKELVSRCLGFNSYADLISNLPVDMEAYKSTFPNELTKTLIAEPFGVSVNLNEIKIIVSNALSVDSLESEINFLDEINQIKKDQNHSVNVEKTQLRRHIKDRFVSWIQQTIDDLENVKEGIKSDASQRRTSSVVMSKVLKVDPLEFDGATLRVIAGISPNITLMQGRNLHRGFDCQYECINTSLLPTKFDRRGLNGRLHYVDETVGKHVILDDKLIELWELLESNGLKPFFYTHYDNVDLHVRI